MFWELYQPKIQNNNTRIGDRCSNCGLELNGYWDFCPRCDAAEQEIEHEVMIDENM